MGTTNGDVGTDSEHIAASLLDPEAFAVLFKRHAVPLQRYIVTRVGRRDAADLVGETFATAFRSRHSYDTKRPDARPWLFGIATNVARHYWRSEDRRAQGEALVGPLGAVGDHDSDVVERIYFEGVRAPLEAALVQIDEPSLDVLLLIAGPGFSYEDVSFALGIPVGTVRSRLSRARARLRELLGDSGQYLDEPPSAARASIQKKGS